MGLLCRSKDRDEVKSIFAQENVARVAQVDCVKQGIIFRKRHHDASRTPNFSCLFTGLNQKLNGLVKVLVRISSFTGLALDVCTEFPRVFSGIDTLMRPATNTIGKRYQIICDRCSIFTSFLTLSRMRKHKKA